MGAKKQSREPMSVERLFQKLFVARSTVTPFYFSDGIDTGDLSYDFKSGHLTFQFEADEESEHASATYAFTLDGLPPF